MKTLGQQFNDLAFRIMPDHEYLQVPERMDTVSEIDEHLFRYSEYAGGMAAVLLTILMMEEDL